MTDWKIEIKIDNHEKNLAENDIFFNRHPSLSVIIRPKLLECDRFFLSK